MSPYGKEFIIQVFAYADWAGCATTRRSTAGVIVQVMNSTVHHHSNTQTILATSSGESKLYAIGSATVEALHIRTILLGPEFATRARATVHTYSTTSTSIDTRHGTTKATRHIQLRYLFLHDLVTT